MSIPGSRPRSLDVSSLLRHFSSRRRAEGVLIIGGYDLSELAGTHRSLSSFNEHPESEDSGSSRRTR
jgi:hypothetical protein